MSQPGASPFDDLIDEDAPAAVDPGNQEELQMAQSMLWGMDNFRPSGTTKVVACEPAELEAPAMSGSASMRRRSLKSLRRRETSDDPSPDDGDGTTTDAPMVEEVGEVSVREDTTPPTTAPAPTEPETKTETVLKDRAAMNASERSVLFRDEDFRPYNSWIDDRTAFLAQVVETEEPIDLLPQADQEIVKNRRFFQVENNAQGQHYEVLGFNAYQNEGRQEQMPQAIVVGHADDDTIVYCTGSHITSVDMVDRGKRRMLPRSEQCIHINTFTVSASGKYVAVVERRVDGPCVAVSRVDSGTSISVLSTAAIAKTLVISLAISSNNKYLATVTAAPEHKLTLWQLEDQRVMASEDLLGVHGVEVTGVLFSPWDSTILSTVGPHRLLQWEYLNRALAMTDFFEATTREAKVSLKYSKLVDHTWYDEDCMCALTEDGTLLAVEQRQTRFCKAVQLPPLQDGAQAGGGGNDEAPADDGLRRTMSSRSFSPTASLSMLDRSLGKTMQVRAKVAKSGYTFRHVVWASRGVIVTASGGTLALLDRTYDSRVFAPVCVFHVTNRKAEIVAVSMSPAEENLVVALSINTMEVVQLATLDDAIANRDTWDSSLPIGRESQMLLQQKKGDGMIRTGVDDEDERWGFVMRESVFVEIPHASFHEDTVTSLSIAMQMPLVLTTSADGTARLYNYLTHEIAAFKRFTADEILSAAIHPMGIHCIFTTEFSTQVFGVLGGQFYLHGDLDVRGAVDVKYSNQGGRLAFCVGNKVLIYDGHSYQLLGQLQGHTVMIKSIAWSDNDRRLLTTDVAGTICGWNTTTLLRDGLDLSQKNLLMQCAKYHPETDLVVGVGVNKQSQRKIFEGEFTILCAPATNPQAIVYLRPGMVLPKTVASRKLHTTLLAFAELSQTLFVGTPAGRIFLYSWPLVRSSKPYDYIDIDTNEILHLVISPDERFLFAVTASNVMFIMKLDQQKEGRYVNVVSLNHDLFACLRYALKSDEDAYSRDAAAIRHLVGERRRVNSEGLALLKDTLKTDVERHTAEQQNTVVRMRAELDKARATRIALEKRTIHDGLEVESQYSIAAESLEVQYARLQEEGSQRYMQLLRDKEEITVKYEALMGQRIMAGEREVKIIEERRVAMVQRLSSEILAVDAQVKDKARRMDAMLAQTVVDNETDAKEMTAQHTWQVLRAEENLQRAGAMASIGDREVERLEKECTAQRGVLDVKRLKMKEITKALEYKGREAAELKLQMVAKQEAINVAEKKLQALKHQLSVLENIKFVLLHQLDAEAAEIEPKNERIEELGEELASIELELGTAEAERQQADADLRRVDTELQQATALHAKTAYDRFLVERRLNHVLAIVSKAAESFRDPLQFSVLLRRTVDEIREELAKPVVGPAPAAAASAGPHSVPTTAAAAAAAAAAAGSRSGTPKLPLPPVTRVVTPPTQVGSAVALLQPIAKQPPPPAVEDHPPALLREFAKITGQLQRKKVAMAVIPAKRQQQLEAEGADTLMDSQQLVEEIKTLRAGKREVLATIGVLERELRETRNSLARLVDNNKKQLLAERKPLLLTERRTPSPAVAATPIAAASAGPSPTPSGGPPTVARKALPPLSATPLPRRTPTPVALDDLEVTWGSVKKAPASAQPHSKKLADLPPRRDKKKLQQPTAALEAKRADLHAVIAQLEENTLRMRSQQETVGQLRATIQRLLALEEQRLVSTLQKSKAAEAQLEASGCSGDGDGDGAVDLTVPLVADGPDWVAESGRPMTPVKGVA